MAFFTVAVISALCLLLPMTRVYGLLGAGILIYFFSLSNPRHPAHRRRCLLLLLPQMTQEIFRMTYENQTLDALMIISAWEIPDKDIAHVVTQQTKLMSGINSDEPWEDHLDTY